MTPKGVAYIEYRVVAIRQNLGATWGTLNRRDLSQEKRLLIFTHFILLTGLPPDNDKIYGTLSTAENFVPKKNFFFLIRGRVVALCLINMI